MRGNSTHYGAAALAIWAALSGAPAKALLFEPVSAELAGNISALWIRDCGRLDLDTQRGCREWETKFAGPRRDKSGRIVYRGDSRQLYDVLAERKRIGKPFDEIWMYSGGGNLVEGVEVGRVLRRFQATVRVPAGARCVSSCTVAFMGGLFRTVHERGSYEVHAASAFLNGFENHEDLLKRLLSDRGSDTEDELKRFAEHEQRGEPFECDFRIGADGFLLPANCNPGARAWAKLLMAYFQQGILPLGVRAANSDRLDRWLRSEISPAAYLSSGEVRTDALRIRREGEPAAQEIVMKLERISMDQAIQELRRIAPELGPRAAEALDMLDAMYSSRIIFTRKLSSETLIGMGYITRFITR